MPLTRGAATAAAGRAGPVPFKDIVVDGDGGDAAVAPARQPPAAEEYRDAIAMLPRSEGMHHAARRLPLRQYQGTWFPELWMPGVVALQRRFRSRPGDVVLASLPKCGATWLKALAFATAARGEHPPPPVGGGSEHHHHHHPLQRLSPHDCVPFVELTYLAGEEAKLEAAPSPRLMSTHASYAVLPASITENSECKIIYIHRQPKDMLISYWHFMKPKLGEDYTATSISDVWRSISEEKYVGSPIWEHILGYWYASKTKSDSVLFLQYDELLHNPVKNVEKIAEFIGQPFSDAEREAGIVDAIVRLCSFEMLKDLGVNRTGFTEVGNVRVPNELFFRKGTAGDWVNHVTPEMSESLDRFLSEKFHGSGFSLQ